MPDTKMPKIHVCFLPKNSELLQAHVLNSAAAWFAPQSDGPPMVHAEVFFPSQETETHVGGLSCGIHYGGQVFFHRKTFSRKNWIFRALTCTQQQYDKMVRFCRQQVGGGFNYWGYFTPCNVSTEARLTATDPQRWYCSELSSAILHNGGILDYEEGAAHPHELYAAIKDKSFADCGRNLNSRNLTI